MKIIKNLRHMNASVSISENYFDFYSYGTHCARIDKNRTSLEIYALPSVTTSKQFTAFLEDYAPVFVPFRASIRRYLLGKYFTRYIHDCNFPLYFNRSTPDMVIAEAIYDYSSGCVYIQSTNTGEILEEIYV